MTHHHLGDCKVAVFSLEEPQALNMNTPHDGDDGNRTVLVTRKKKEIARIPCMNFPHMWWKLVLGGRRRLHLTTQGNVPGARVVSQAKRLLYSARLKFTSKFLCTVNHRKPVSMRTRTPTIIFQGHPLQRYRSRAASTLRFLCCAARGGTLKAASSKRKP